MNTPDLSTIARSAKDLSRNPLGIIALFIVLIYALASIIVANSGWMQPHERIPLIYFMVIFPVLVLFVFAWLVSKHARSLYAPYDYKDEKNFVTIQQEVTSSLLKASTRHFLDKQGAESQLSGNNGIESLDSFISKQTMSYSTKRRILWVDDIPENNTYERKAFEALGISISIATSTNEAMAFIENNDYSAIISDMGRKEGQREGYVLLDKIRSNGLKTPFFIYAGSNLPEHKKEAEMRGAQGSTNIPSELFKMVVSSLI